MEFYAFLWMLWNPNPMQCKILRIRMDSIESKNPYNDFKLICLFFIDRRFVVVNASHSGTRNK